MTILLTILTGCVEAPLELPPDAPTDGQRLRLPDVTFNLWPDKITMQAAADDTCRFQDPLLEDDSTSWPPLQTFWVIYEDPRDVELTRIEDTFFVGDVVVPAVFEEVDGLDALGFLYIGGFQQSLLEVEDVRRFDDDRTLEADFGPPIDATMRVELTELETGCSATSTFCEGDCSQAFAPLSGIHLDLGTFFSVQNVEFRP